MNLFIIILLTNCAYLFGERIYKYQLRGIYKQEVDRLIEEALQGEFNTIYNKIIDLATNGVNEYKGFVSAKKIYCSFRIN